MTKEEYVEKIQKTYGAVEKGTPLTNKMVKLYNQVDQEWLKATSTLAKIIELGRETAKFDGEIGAIFKDITERAKKARVGMSSPAPEGGKLMMLINREIMNASEGKR